jgi:nitroreductase
MGFERICQRLLEYGVLAPSIYNSQPWKFLVDGSRGIIEVQADISRARPSEIDEKQRDLYLALGACIENIILAAPALGYEIEPFLFPKADVVASLRLSPMTETTPENLFPSLLIRQTHAGHYKKNSVQPLHLERLLNVPAFSAHEKLYVLNSDVVPKQLIPFLHDLSHEGALNQILINEGARWIRTKPEAGDGLPLTHLGLPISVKARFALLRYLFFKKEVKEVARQTLLRQGHLVDAPAFMLITVQKSGKEDYLNAGRWYARLALTLSEIELGAQTLHLPITLKTAHASLLDFFKASPNEEPVFLVRLGQPLEKKWPKTPRRPLSQSIEFVLKINLPS